MWPFTSFGSDLPYIVFPLLGLFLVLKMYLKSNPEVKDVAKDAVSKKAIEWIRRFIK